MSQITTFSVSQIAGEYTPPSDKSISHRLVMLGSLAEGESRFEHFLEAEDCLNTAEAFKQMGVAITRAKGVLTVKGVGLYGLQAPAADLYLGNSGTTIRLLMGILAGQSFEVKLTGDPSLSKRPMKRVTVPLRKMGARISGAEDANFAPLTIKGGKLNGIEWVSEVASAQVKSSILLAGLFAEGQTTVREPELSRDHTERLFELFAVPVTKAPLQVSVKRPKKLKAVQFAVPGDISSAAFLLVAAALLPGSDLTIRRVGLNPTRIGVIEVLKLMGADIQIDITSQGPEPYGDLHVRGNRLKPITIEKWQIPSLIDELPILMIACALADGESVIKGAEELRVKETDRIKSMVTGLNLIGGQAEEKPDGCVIRGVKRFTGGKIESYGDHRTAMSFAIAGFFSDKEILIKDTECIQTSYPKFESDLQACVQF